MKLNIFGKRIDREFCVYRSVENTFERIPLEHFVSLYCKDTKNIPLIYYIGTIQDCNTYIRKYTDIFKNNNPDIVFFHVLHEIEKEVGEKPKYKIHSLFQFNSHSLEVKGFPVFIGYIEDIKEFGENLNINICKKLEVDEYTYPSKRKNLLIPNTQNMKNQGEEDAIYVLFPNPQSEGNYLIMPKEFCQEPASLILFTGTKDECEAEFIAKYKPKEKSSEPLNCVQTTTLELGKELIKNNEDFLTTISKLIELNPKSSDFFLLKSMALEVNLILMEEYEGFELKKED